MQSAQNVYVHPTKPLLLIHDNDFNLFPSFDRVESHLGLGEWECLGDKRLESD